MKQAEISSRLQQIMKLSGSSARNDVESEKSAGELCNEVGITGSWKFDPW